MELTKKEKVDKYFADKIVIKIQQPKVNELLSCLTGLINGDNCISVADKKALLETAGGEKLNIFLPNIFYSQFFVQIN